MTQSQAELISIQKKDLKRLPITIGILLIVAYGFTRQEKSNIKTIVMCAILGGGILAYYSKKIGIDKEEKNYNTLPIKGNTKL